MTSKHQGDQRMNGLMETGGCPSKDLQRKIEEEGIPLSPEEGQVDGSGASSRYQTPELERKVAAEGIPVREGDYFSPAAPEEAGWNDYLSSLKACRAGRLTYAELAEKLRGEEQLFSKLDEIRRMHIYANLSALALESGKKGKASANCQKVYQRALSLFESALEAGKGYPEKDKGYLKEIIDAAGKHVPLAEKLLMHTELISGKIIRELANLGKMDYARLGRLERQLRNLGKNADYLSRSASSEEYTVLEKMRGKIENINSEIKKRFPSK